MLIMILTGCAVNPTQPTHPEIDMSSSVKIIEITFDKSYYKPGEPVQIQVSVESTVDQSVPVNARMIVSSLAATIGTDEQKVDLVAGNQQFRFTYLPPRETPHGYGIDIQLITQDDQVFATATSAFDVLDNWVENPRYGFLTDFEPARKDAVETMSILNRYHINGLQFYDWMYRHEQFLTNTDPYYDLWSPKPHSIYTVNALIDAAHQFSMAAMPYTAVYGSSRDYALEHPDMILYNSIGKPTEFGGDKMMIMDPRPDSPWTLHLLNQFKEVLQKTAFDGIHLDQYGDPKVGYDQKGNSYELAPVLADFINLTKDLTDQFSKEDAVVFNAVDNWPIESVAPSKEDFVYIEVWPPYIWFSDLHQVIVNAQKLGNGKPVVLAAYIDPTFENNAILNDAIILGSGAGHIEIGEKNGMLAEAYFPNYKVISDALSKTLQRYYDFSVRYEDVTGPQTKDATMIYQKSISIPGSSTSPSQLTDKVWPIVRESGHYTTINLINFLGINETEWTKQIPAAPSPLSNFELTISSVTKIAGHVWFASPDHSEINLHPIKFSQNADLLTISVPDLTFWSMIVIDWSE